MRIGWSCPTSLQLQRVCWLQPDVFQFSVLILVLTLGSPMNLDARSTQRAEQCPRFQTFRHIQIAIQAMLSVDGNVRKIRIVWSSTSGMTFNCVSCIIPDQQASRKWINAGTTRWNFVFFIHSFILSNWQGGSPNEWTDFDAHSWIGRHTYTIWVLKLRDMNLPRVTFRDRRSGSNHEKLWSHESQRRYMIEICLEMSYWESYTGYRLWINETLFNVRWPLIFLGQN